ncbi:hypothetical protein [Jeotgalibaca caeni]|uniref:hypothetical protein n=1 Tax=Jeotgalibaca caeni TaxID=3028623 RepID=UPI00237DAB3F|nr:hypothetical protein [Jeotgalibaca caeni]MDE1548350.1 hypothetical protein [Jeotgalibaca caeni]
MKNNKKKSLPLLLLALLMISVGAYGTRAYFSDSAVEKADIKLVLGDLDIESTSDKVWTYSGVNKTIGTNGKTFDETASKEIKYVQPGDVFKREFTFENTGTLHQIVSTKNTIKKLGDELFTVNLTGELVDHKSIELAPLTSTTVTVELIVNNLENEYNTKQDTDGIIDLLGESIAVDAVQLTQQSSDSQNN